MPRHRKAVQSIALFLVFAVVHLCVLASGAGLKVYAQDAASRAPQGSGGMLTTTGNKDILVDRNEVSTGTTILDGAVLETSNCVAATVRWGALDEVRLATNTIATLNHSEGKLKVILKQGCVTASGGKDVEVTVETPDGKVVTATQLDGSNRKSVQVCYPPQGGNYDFNPSCGGGFAKTGGILAGVAGVIALIALVASNSRGDNPSDMTP